MGAPAEAGTSGRRAFRRVWLPTIWYEAMPWIYCSLGASALLSGLFLPDPGWMAPYLLLVAVTALHVGLWFLMLRRRYRLGRRRRQRQARSPAGRALPGSAGV
jgi:O-antigen/teichoic acid export membrane protein